MVTRVRKLRTGALLAPLALGGCLLLTPLDDFEKAPAGGAGSGSDDGGGAGQAGGSGAGNASGEAGANAVGGEGGSQTGGEGGSAVGKGGGTTAGAAGAEPTGCRTNTECIEDAGGAAARCRPDGTCVALKTGDCPLAYGDFADDRALYIGTFAPLPDDIPGSSTVIQAQRLALDELSGSVQQGLPDADGKRHPIVMIGCDNGTTEQVLDAMDHLANAVKVPAVLAMLQPGDMLEVFDRFAEHKLFYLNPVGATENVVELDDEGLVWNVLGQPSDLVPVYVELVRALEIHIRNRRGLTPEDLIRVALVTTTDAFNTELANLVGEDLEINGMAPAENDSDHYRLFKVRLVDPDDDETPVAIGDAVREFQPDLVISTANEAYTRGVLERIELSWMQSHDDAPRPFHLLSPYNAGDMDYVTSLVAAVMGLGDTGIVTDADANLRFVGIEAAGPVDRTLQNQYATRLGQDYPNAGADSGNYYDAFYYLAYAIYAAGAGPALTGPEILTGFTRLLAGPSFDVGPNQISNVFTALEPENSSIELVGTLGPPNFFNGIRADAGSVFCIERDGANLNKVGDALRYNRTTREFDGEFPCFEAFPPPSP
jgi:hypothetical protein